MIRLLVALFERPPREDAAALQHSIRLAAAALLVETARANFTQSDAELDRLRLLLQGALRLTANEVRELVDAARTQVEDATSLYDFTRVINAHCSPEQKIQLLGAMWDVAYADGDADKYEEHLIRNVADLLYIPHSSYIHCKLSAQGRAA